MRRLLICFVITIGTTSWAGCSVSSKNVPQNPLLGSFRSKARPATVDRQLALARLSERHGQPGKAVKIYQNVISKVPNEVVAHQRLAILAAKRGHFDEAMKHFENAKRSGEPSAQLLGDIGYAYYLQHKLPEAEAHFRDALEADPSDARARTNLGLVLGEQGRFDESLVEFQQAGDEAAAYSNLAYVQSQVGHLEQAEANFHKALKYDPSNRHAAEALIQVAAKTSVMSAPTPSKPRGVQSTERALANSSGAQQRQNLIASTNEERQVRQAVTQGANAPMPDNHSRRNPAATKVANSATSTTRPQDRKLGAQVAKSPLSTARSHGKQVVDPSVKAPAPRRQNKPAMAQVVKSPANKVQPQRRQEVIPRNNMSRPRTAVVSTPSGQSATAKVVPVANQAEAEEPRVVTAGGTILKQAALPPRVQVAEVPAPLRIQANPFLQNGGVTAAAHSPTDASRAIPIQMPTGVPIQKTTTSTEPPAKALNPAKSIVPALPRGVGQEQEQEMSAHGDASSQFQPLQQTPAIPQSTRIPPSLTTQPFSNHIPPSLTLPRGVPISR